MNLHDCVSKNSSQTELLLVFSEAAYEAAKLGRDRMTQAALPIDRSFILEEEMADALGNDVCQSLIAALGTLWGIVLVRAYGSLERLFDITKLRYGKIILVTEQGQLGRRASNEVLRFQLRASVIDGGYMLMSCISPLNCGVHARMNLLSINSQYRDSTLENRRQRGRFYVQKAWCTARGVFRTLEILAA